LHETKNKQLFEIYRADAKNWSLKKGNNKTQVSAGILDEFVNKKMNLEDYIKIIYNPWKQLDMNAVTAIVRTSNNVLQGHKTEDVIYS
jgi:hypothetical protein